MFDTRNFIEIDASDYPDVGMCVGKVVNRHKMAQHFVLVITDTTFAFEHSARGIAAEAALDKH